MKQPMIDTMQREKFDDLYTPDEAVRLLLKYVPLLSGRIVWECCDDGKSNITDILSSEYKIKSTDIKTGFDFLKDTPDFHFDCIVTNPPYSLKDDFLEKCYHYGKPFALLLPLTALEGKRRGKLFRTYGISLIVINSRLDFTGKGANWFNTSWFCGNGFIYPNTLIFEDIDDYR